MHSYRFPAESPQYRTARDELLAAERDLRGQVERVAAMRRNLPMGGLTAQDYEFEEQGDTGDASKVRLSQLFAPGYHCEEPGGGQNSILHVFARRPDGVHHFWSTELNLMPAEPGQNHRHIDMMWPLWNVLDTTPEGRGTDWFPAIRYDP
jgi:predicted dithiol-disulfide oxidoreductase (DUF899 family)